MIEMPRAKGAINIAASANVVWDRIIEPERYLVWNTDFTEYTIVDDKEEKVGTTYYMVGEKGGAPVKIDCIVAEWVENGRFSFRGTSKEGMEAEGTFTIELTGEGCTVSLEEDLELPGVKGKIIGALFLKKAKLKNIEAALQSLKRAIETNLSA